MKQDFFFSAEHGPLWAQVDKEWYLKHYGYPLILPDDTDIKAIYRCIAAEKSSSPNPFFNEAWYISVFKDVAALIKSGEIESGFEHYVTIGYKSRSPHWLFSESFYRMTNWQLTQSFLNEGGFLNGYDHFLRIGDYEKRQPSLFFDPQLYLQSFSNECDGNLIGPFLHFAGNSFKNEHNKRFSWYFDSVWYAEIYPDIRLEINAGTYTSTLEHYLRNPMPRRFNPSSFFSEDYYLSQYPDITVAIAAGQFRNGYDHFTQYGVFELRTPNPDIDLSGYFRRVSVQADIENGLYRDAYAHYVASADFIKKPKPALIHENQSKQLFSVQAINLATVLARQRLSFEPHGDPKITVIMILHKNIELNLQTLESLRKTTVYTEIDLILIDISIPNATNATRKFIDGAQHIKFDWNIGYSQAYNAAIALVKAPAILFLSSDVIIGGDSVRSAYKRLFSAGDIGAVGGKVVRSNGLLQEAGGIIWLDGSMSSYCHNKSPNSPEANFVRQVDFCSTAFLMVRTISLKIIKGFDEVFSLMCFAEANLSVQLLKSGFRTIYDPAVILVKYEDFELAPIITKKNCIEEFHKKNEAFLLEQPRRWVDSDENARHSIADRRRRILFIEDRIPLRHLGSGYTRANDIVHAMVRLNYQVTIFPIYQVVESFLSIINEFPDNVEIIYDRELPDFSLFLTERQDYYDIIWIGRTQNATRVFDVLNSANIKIPYRQVILDTEAIAALRNQLRNSVYNIPTTSHSLASDVLHELRNVGQVETVIAVNEIESAIIKNVGIKSVNILGHTHCINFTSRHFEQRRGLLFVGALHDKDSPNLDSLIWFVNNVLPKLAARLPAATRLTVAGYVNKRIDLSIIGRVEYVDLHGPVDDLAPLYDEHRIFVAPTRFAAGIPYKVHEAAGRGIPIVASQLLANQLGWTSGVELLTADPADPESFAAQICNLYFNQELWEQIRERAAKRMAQENSEAFYDKQLDHILEQIPSIKNQKA